MFERTGHLANLEQPERFNKAVLDFLSRHTAR
jgi:pimeloyl-ACP methyl ester carboxylesterase